MDKTVIGLFDDVRSAEQVVRELTSAGFEREQISLVANDPEDRAPYGERGEPRFGSVTDQSVVVRNDPPDETEGSERSTGEAAMDGAGVGAALGGIAGLLVGLGALAIPGIGPVLAAGPLAAALAGAGLGAAAGGMIGALTNAGVPEREARFYAEGVRRGGSLVMVRTTSEKAQRAADILNRLGAVDVQRRASDWERQDQSKGGSGFTAHSTESGDATAAPESGGAPISGPASGVDDIAAAGFRTEPDADRGRTDPGYSDPASADPGIRRTGEGYHYDTDRAAERHRGDEPDATDVERDEGRSHDFERREGTREGFENTGAVGRSEAADNRDFAGQGGLGAGDVGSSGGSLPEHMSGQSEFGSQHPVGLEASRRAMQEGGQLHYGEDDMTNQGMAFNRGTGAQESEHADEAFRQHFDAEYGARGVTYDRYRPAYHFGNELGSSEGYGGREWEQIEADVRREWEERNPDSVWDEFKDAVRYGWNRLRGRS